MFILTLIHFLLPSGQHSAAGPETEVAWNFEKFLISKKGVVVGRFLSAVDPESDEIKNAITKEMQK